MSSIHGQHKELLTLLEALCEDRITFAGANRLEEIVLGDEESRNLYMQYIDLHGTLHWDAANGSNSNVIEAEEAISLKPKPVPPPEKPACLVETIKPRPLPDSGLMNASMVNPLES